MGVQCGCHKVKAADWHNKVISFENRSFYTEKIPLIFHIPIGLGKRIEALQEEIRLKEYKIIEPVTTLMKDGTFSGLIMTEIEKPRFFDPQIYTFGPSLMYCYVSTEPWNNLRADFLLAKKNFDSQGKKVKSLYFRYTTCPRCSGVQGYQTLLFLEPET